MLNLKQLRVIQGVAAAALALSIGGCKTEPKDERSEGRVVDDKNITEKVENKMKQETVYKFEGISVATFDGIVQLSGFVNSGEQKERAGQIALEVPGVRQVMNGITLKPEPTITQPTSSTNGTQRIYSQ